MAIHCLQQAAPEQIESADRVTYISEAEFNALRGGLAVLLIDGTDKGTNRRNQIQQLPDTEIEEGK